MKDVGQSKIQVRLALPSRDVSVRGSVPVWVSSVNELRQELESRGATQLLMCYYDSIGDVRNEGTWFSPSDLRDEHLLWLSAPDFHSRQLAFNIR